MSGTLAPLLLRIAAAVDGDGGAAVRVVLESVLQDRAPFEAGEIVYARTSGGHVSFPLGQAPEPFLGHDLVEHAIAQGTPLRLDDLRDAAPFPETLVLLRQRGLRSVLVLPFRFGVPEGPRVRGAVALARSHGWAFAGASLPLLVPVAGLGGLAFDHALRLTALGGEAAASVTPSVPSSAPPPAAVEAPALGRTDLEDAVAEARAARGDASAARTEVDAARALAGTLGSDLEAAQLEAARAAEALREASEAGRVLRSSLEAAQTARLEAERSRDDWAKEAASLRTRAEEQRAEIQGLKRSIAGARESAAAAADVAEVRAVRIRDLEAELQHAIHELEHARREADDARQVPLPPAPPAEAEPEGAPPGPEPAVERRKRGFDRRASRKVRPV